MNRLQACSGFALACLLAFSLQIFFFSPISPDSLEQSPTASTLPTNKELQKVIKLGEGLVEGPEDVVLDREGVLYTATRDGWVKRMHRNGSWENWKKIEDVGALLGITIAKDGSIIVCEAEKGLFKVSDEDGIVVLASHVNGSQIRFADEVIESSDGSLYFTVPSTKFGLHDWYLDVLEAKPNGQVLKYDPSLKETSILLDGLYFPNGICALKGRRLSCLLRNMEGENKGKLEIFVENLPGGPDNINLAPDGSFWIGILQLTTTGLEFVHTSKPLKHIVASFPRLVKLMNGVNKKATVVNVGANGKITRRFDDPDGKVMSFVTNAFEFEDRLYLGTLNANFVGKLPLKSA